VDNPRVFKTLFARLSSFFWYASLGFLLLALWLTLNEPPKTVPAVVFAVTAILSMCVSFVLRDLCLEVSENGIAGHGLLRVPLIGWSEVSKVGTGRILGLNFIVVGSYASPKDFRLGPFTRGDIEKITGIWESRPD
jgi:hypothetical protein